MNILRKIVKKDLLLNKKRTIGTIIGIILASFLITMVSSAFAIFQNSSVQSSIDETGYYHIELFNLNKNDVENIKQDKDFKKIIIINNLKYISPVSNMQIYSMDKESFDYLNIKLVMGRFPRNSNEILLIKGIEDYKIGDTISLTAGDIVDKNGNIPGLYYFGERKLANTRDYTFKVVGFIDTYRPIYVTTGIDINSYNAYLALQNPYHYQKDFSELLGINFNSYNNRGTKILNGVRYDYSINENIISWEVFGYNVNLKVIYALMLLLTLIVMIISVFSIRNSFAISVVEKTRIYAMLKSVGATSKQIRKMVLLEGAYLGLIACPIGIILGSAFSFIISKVINYIIVNYVIDNFLNVYYKFSIYSIILSIIFSIIMIYVSTYLSAKKASIIAPIENIRNAENFKNKKKIKVPRIISKIFKIGGIISYKNLKLSKKKYRVTVISLVVSILSFITFSSFVEYTIKEIESDLPDMEYNVSVSLDGLNSEEINKIASLDKNRIEYYAPYRMYGYILPNNHILYDGIIKNLCITFESNICKESIKSVYVLINIIDDKSFREYVKEAKGNYEEVKDKAILINNIKALISTRPEKFAYYDLTDYHKDDDLNVKFRTSNGNEEESYKIGIVTNVRKYSAKGNYYDELVLFMNEKYFKGEKKPYVMFYNSKNANKLEKEIKKIVPNVYIENTDKELKSNKAIILIISIIIYGFIGVVTFIGLSSVFNTITSNMSSRRKEFAMLKSIGMTKKEFNNMILLEAVFYSFKSLLYGIILGLFGTYLVYKIIIDKVNLSFIIPIKAIIISIIFIIIIVYTIMKYSINKINKQNIIETIRQDNI